MAQDSTQKTFPSSSSASPQAHQDNRSARASGDELVKAKDALLEGAEQLKTELKTAADGAAEQAKKAAETKLDAGRDFAAEHLGSVAYALRKASDELRATDSPITDYVAGAASSVDQVSFYLQTRTLSHVMGDLEGFARREPAMFLGASFITGILAGRFLKSASPASSNGGARGAAAGTQRSAPTPMLALPEYGTAGSGSSTAPRGNGTYSPPRETSSAGGSNDEGSTPGAGPKAPSTELRGGAASPTEGTSVSSQPVKTNGSRNGSDKTSIAGTSGAR